MFDFYERRKLRRVLYSKGAILLLAVVVVFLARAAAEVYPKEREAARRSAEQAAELSELRERERTLTAELGRLSTSRGVEAELREKYDVAKPGERVIVILDSAGRQAAVSEGGSFWRRILDFLGW